MRNTFLKLNFRTHSGGEVVRRPWPAASPRLRVARTAMSSSSSSSASRIANSGGKTTPPPSPAAKWQRSRRSRCLTATAPVNCWPAKRWSITWGWSDRWERSPQTRTCSRRWCCSRSSLATTCRNRWRSLSEMFATATWRCWGRSWGPTEEPSRRSSSAWRTSTSWLESWKNLKSTKQICGKKVIKSSKVDLEIICLLKYFSFFLWPLILVFFFQIVLPRKLTLPQKNSE